MIYKAMPIPSSGQVQMNKFTLNEFRGADYTSGTMLSDIRRSPDTVNMVFGSNPNICHTRPGKQRVLAEIILDDNAPATIYGIHTYKDSTVSQMLVHAGDSLYIIDDTGNASPVYSGLARQYSTSFVFNDNLYIIGCGVYLQWDGVECKKVSDIAFVPTTTIGSTPSLLVHDTYFADGEKTEFSLSRYDKINGDFIRITLNSEIVTGDYTFTDGVVEFSSAPTQGVEVRISYLINSPSGTSFEAVNLLTPQRKNSFIGDGITKVFFLDADDIDSVDSVLVDGEAVESANYTVNKTNGTVTFNAAPADGNGIDNVVITFSKEIDGYADRINNCTVCEIFGGNNDTRVFLSGNPEYKNVDWYSGLYDATYFPDINYTKITSDSTAIMGYIKQFNTLMPIKEGNTQGDTASLRTFALDSEGNPYFPVEQGAVGIGAVSKRAFGYLQGEPLFLSSQGVVRVTGTNVDNQRLIQDCSSLINPRLTKEQGLENAFALVYNNTYHLFINGKCYLADARKRFTDELNQVQYEWLYWENVHASAGAVFDGYMYIGYLGQIYRFKKDEGDLYSDDGVGIYSKWVTPIIYFGDASVKKSIENVYILLSDIDKNDVHVKCVINGNAEVDLGEVSSERIFNFTDIDFGDITFNTSINRYAEKLKAKLKKIDNLQFVFTNTGNRRSAMGIALLQSDFIYLTR
jgi:hypothetical protein